MSEKFHWVLELLGPKHDRNSFDCGEPALNHYLQQLARQHAKKNISKTFVVVSKPSPTQILGFYTLSTGSIVRDFLSLADRKKLPNYPIPIARIGRLAIDKSIQGQGLGEELLKNALHRCVNLSKEIGLYGVVVDAKHEKAKAFYLKFGFCELIEHPLTLYLPISTIMATTIQ
jgi:GNAT superfamily N-acetyltransferase